MIVDAISRLIPPPADMDGEGCAGEREVENEIGSIVSCSEYESAFRMLTEHAIDRHPFMDAARADLEDLMSAEDLDWIGRKLIDECRAKLPRAPFGIIFIGPPIMKGDARGFALDLASWDLFGEFIEELLDGIHK